MSLYHCGKVPVRTKTAVFPVLNNSPEIWMQICGGWPKVNWKQQCATCNALFLKWAEIPYEDGIWRFEQNGDVTQPEVPTVFIWFSMQEHIYRWLIVKMLYIRLPKYLVHFRWWKDTVKIVIKTVSGSLI